MYSNQELILFLFSVPPIVRWGTEPQKWRKDLLSLCSYAMAYPPLWTSLLALDLWFPEGQKKYVRCVSMFLGWENQHQLRAAKKIFHAHLRAYVYQMFIKVFNGLLKTNKSLNLKEIKVTLLRIFKMQIYQRTVNRLHNQQVSYSNSSMLVTV